MSGSDLGRIGLDLMLAGFAPYDGPDLFRGGGTFGAVTNDPGLRRDD